VLDCDLCKSPDILNNKMKRPVASIGGRLSLVSTCWSSCVSSLQRSHPKGKDLMMSKDGADEGTGAGLDRDLRVENTVMTTDTSKQRLDDASHFHSAESQEELGRNPRYAEVSSIMQRFLASYPSHLTSVPP
jgi:hypothetical protein